MNRATNPSDTDLIIFTDDAGRPTGETGPKVASHGPYTRRHLAFSVYVFNSDGQLLVTQRSHNKTVWPLIWSNTCCGHPLPGETIPQAIARRLQYELGMTASTPVLLLPDYKYTTPPYRGIVENEFCPVYVAQITTEPSPNPLEIEAFKWISWPDLLAAARTDSSDYSNPTAADAPIWSYWMKDQLAHFATAGIDPFASLSAATQV